MRQNALGQVQTNKTKTSDNDGIIFYIGMSMVEKEPPTSEEPYSIRFRAQFGDVGPFEVHKTELSLDDLTERAYRSWPKGMSFVCCKNAWNEPVGRTVPFSGNESLWTTI